MRSCSTVHMARSGAHRATTGRTTESRGRTSYGHQLRLTIFPLMCGSACGCTTSIKRRLSAVFPRRRSLNRVQRRQFLIAAGALLATPLAVGAQQAAKVARIGYLTSSRGVNPHLPEAFRQGLRDLGYVE